MTAALRPFWKIQVHVPVDPPLWGSEQPLNAHPHVRAVVAALASIPGVGRVGNYDHVCELALGWEGYRAKPGAAPRVGTIGERVVLPSITVTCFLDCDRGESTFDRIVAAVKAVHPWEHPIIQFSECLLYLPPPA